MSAPTQLAAEIVRLVGLFLMHCDDRAILFQLKSMALRQDRWHEGHALFREIRSKTLIAERARNSLRSAQYLFEEACAKSLYNLSGFPAPFDSNSSDWIRPNAAALARELGMPELIQAVGPEA